MKLAIDARGVNWYKGTGIGTYSYNLFKQLLNNYKENDYTFFWSGKDYHEFNIDNNSIIMTSKRHQSFFENYYIPEFINKHNFEIYHIPQNGIGLSKNIECKKIVTIHDLIPYIMPETVGKGYLKKFVKEMPDIIDNSDGILTVSHYSKKDILKFFPNFPKDKIFVTPLASDDSFRPLNKNLCLKDVQNKYNFSNPYILYIGGFSARKNVSGLIKAFKNSINSLNSKLTLVIVGALRDEGKQMIDLVNDLNIENEIIFTDFVEDSYLPILYNGCEVFVYPSYYEGFGLPPLEAMSCKVPVITSNITSIPEVVSDCGILINPSNSDSLSNALVKILNDENLKENLAKKGYERSKKFSWKNTSIKTFEAYISI